MKRSSVSGSNGAGISAIAVLKPSGLTSSSLSAICRGVPAQKVWREWMAHNKTPMSEVEEDPTFWPGTPQQIADKLLEVMPLGFNTAIAEIPAPFDPETLERFIGEVKPLVDRG